MKDFILDILFKKGFELCQGKHLDYSSMRENGIDSRYIKDNIIFIWGLHEKGKPPTLISPRPRITKTITKTVREWREQGFILNNKVKLDENVTITLNETYDDLMNEVLNKFSHYDIIEACTNKNIIFNLNTNTLIK